MDRREKILKGLNLATMSGLEIGPRDRPVVRKTDGAVVYVDYMDTESLRELHLTQRATDCVVDNLVHVDAIWGENTIEEAVGMGEKFDYIVASHVIEHVPDLISWLRELGTVLKPDGVITLAIPDKRYCFDHLRDESSITDVLTAYFLRARRPQPQQIIDFCLHFNAVDTAEAWRGAASRPPVTQLGQLEHALAMAQSSMDGVYQDVHCWAFTPDSFTSIIEQITAFGLLDLSCDAVEATAHNELEFFAKLSRRR
jgi:SAM-dependent methyltransferase